MIIVLKDANFANNNIGEVEVPRIINQFTLNAITASGNTFTDTRLPLSMISSRLLVLSVLNHQSGRS